jgi:hypothetical protein
MGVDNKNGSSRNRMGRYALVNVVVVVVKNS